jgi:ligand-binding SRPBCC domain-containing protein
MKSHLLTRTQILPGTPEVVFPFFEKPENLSRLTPTWLSFKMLTPSPVEMKAGGSIDYAISWMGIPMRWKTLITSYRPPAYFVDEQVKGPYALWQHSHTFSRVDGGTRMVDEVRYALRGGFAGELVHRMIVRKQLERIFDFRAKVIADLFSAGASAPASRTETTKA